MELRKDYVLDRYVIIATERGKRPSDFMGKEKSQPKDAKFGSVCSFCPGSEAQTPPEIGRIEHDKKWSVRWFENKFPAVEPKGNSVIRTDNEYFTFSDSYGIHEVIVETPIHTKQLWEFSKEEIADVLKVYQERISTLGRMNGIKYVQVFKNHGQEAGTSIAHSHSQVIANGLVPFWIQKEIEGVRRYGYCPYCKIWEIERKSYRRVFENDSFVAFTPYASRFPFEVWIFPKNHIKNITECNDNEIQKCAESVLFVLSKLRKLNAPYNMLIHYAPDNEDLHFHIEIIPRLSTWAGFEFFGTVINTVSPEIAAAFYRGEKTDQ